MNATAAPGTGSGARDRMEKLLHRIAKLLREAGRPREAVSFVCLARDAAASNTADERRELARFVLRLYGGTGSFNDLVVSPVGRGGRAREEDRAPDDELDRLRHALYRQARDLI